MSRQRRDKAAATPPQFRTSPNRPRPTRLSFANSSDGGSFYRRAGFDTLHFLCDLCASHRLSPRLRLPYFFASYPATANGFFGPRTSGGECSPPNHSSFLELPDVKQLRAVADRFFRSGHYLLHLRGCRIVNSRVTPRDSLSCYDSGIHN